MADPSNDQLTIYTNDMKSYGMRNGVAEFLKMPRDRVRVVWMEGPQGYGRTAADDAGFEAAYLAKEIGRPVRVQWTRQEETAWDTKGPAYAFKMRGGLDAQGNLVALHYDACAADHNHLGYNEHETVLISQLMGTRKATPSPRPRVAAVGHVRDPEPQADHEGGAAADAVRDAASHRQPARPRWSAGDVCGGELHRRARGGGEGGSGGVPLEDAAGAHGRRQRLQARALDRVHQGGGGEVRLGPAPVTEGRVGNGDVLTGRGIAYSYRSQTVVAEIAEVEVNRKTGRIWVKRLVIAHDCGLVINPAALTRVIECGALYGLSRALHEEVKFDTEKVTSVDWVTHPTLTHADTPERIDVVLVNGDPNPNRPDLQHYGAGETMCKPMLAAVANAVFDATGVRMREDCRSDERRA